MESLGRIITEHPFCNELAPITLGCTPAVPAVRSSSRIPLRCAER